MQRNPRPNGKNPPKSSFVFFDGLPYQSYTLVLIALLSIQLKVLSYGATISSLKVRDASGAWREVVLGFDSLEGYLADENRLKMNWANVDLTHYNILQQKIRTGSQAGCLPPPMSEHLHKNLPGIWAQ